MKSGNNASDKISNIALTLTQGQEYDDHINRVTELITIARLYLLNVKASHEKNTRTKEFDEFNTSLTRIEHRVASINVTLCRWKASKIQHLLDERNRNNNIQKPIGDNTKNEPNTPRFQSWALLCLGTNRCYPNTNDIFYSQTYTKRPEGPNHDSLCYYSRTNQDCRICIPLENEGKDQGDLYTNHYGNLPTHCPQWIKMGITRRARAAKQADYCTQCSPLRYS